MTAFATDAGSFALAAGTALVATPVAISVANRTGFLDRPRQYRKHAKATPFLGGSAAIAGFVLAALTIAGAAGSLLVPIACAIALWALGTFDDRFSVRPLWRVLAEIGAGTALYAAGLGWMTGLGGIVNLALTIVSVVIAVNAFNLMDNLDGACGAVTAVAGIGIGALAVIRGHTAVGAMAFAVSGACAGFLPWNLSGPAKIFLGDGGSMPLGFLAAALAIAVSRHVGAGGNGLLIGALIVGLPIFDTTLVSLSRARRGVSLLTGGRDHLTHRLLLRLHDPRYVALAIAALQAILCGAAILGYELGTIGLTALALGIFLLGLGAIFQLDTDRWRPDGIAIAHESLNPHQARGAESVGID